MWSAERSCGVVVPAAVALLLACAMPCAAAPAFPFSWDTLPTFAFPGAAPRFMTPAEEAFYVSSFDNILIWGLNATCLAADGTETPANCPHAASHCWCDEQHPETQTWALTMETSLQEQGRRLKVRNPNFPVLGYIEVRRL